MAVRGHNSNVPDNPRIGRDEPESFSVLLDSSGDLFKPPFQDRNDSALSEPPRFDPLDPCRDPITVHRVAHVGRADEDVPVGLVWDHKPIAISMALEPACNDRHLTCQRIAITSQLDKPALFR